MPTDDPLRAAIREALDDQMNKGNLDAYHYADGQAAVAKVVGAVAAVVQPLLDAERERWKMEINEAWIRLDRLGLNRIQQLTGMVGGPSFVDALLHPGPSGPVEPERPNVPRPLREQEGTP